MIFEQYKQLNFVVKWVSLSAVEPPTPKGECIIKYSNILLLYKKQVFALANSVLPFRGRGFGINSMILRSMLKSKSVSKLEPIGPAF